MNNNYVTWLRERGVPLFKAGDTYWQWYKNALIPACVGPCFVNLHRKHAKVLLQESRAWFLRYSSDPVEERSAWWYIICDSFDLGRLSAKARNQIKRGNRSCTVRRLDAEWLAKNGHSCYLAAFRRYRNATPVGDEAFRKSILTTIGGPVEFWGVFVGQHLAGYCQCLIESGDVATSVMKLDSDYLEHYTSYALINRLVDHYVVEHGMRISNGNRSIAHDTNFQDFLLKLGFRRQYCRLNLVYRPWLKAGIGMAFPFRGLIASFPSFPDRAGIVDKFQSLLLQEQLQRQCR